MPRGGYREGAGGKLKWKHGKTKVIRVPEALADEILKYARELDENLFESVTQKEINLSGVSLGKINGEFAIKLSSLVNMGYLIKPESLTDIILQNIYQKSLKKSN